METLTIRVSRSTHEVLRGLSNELGKTMMEVVDEAVADYRKKRFWAAYDAAYFAIRADPEAWADFQNEVNAWDVTLADTLEPPHEQRANKRKKSASR